MTGSGSFRAKPALIKGRNHRAVFIYISAGAPVPGGKMGRYKRQPTQNSLPSGSCKMTKVPGFISYHPDLSGSKSHQSCNLDRTSIRPVAQRSDIEMNAVLHALSLRDPLERQPGPLPGRILDPVPVAEILLAMPKRPQGRMDAVDIRRCVTKDRGPEGSQGRRVSAVNGHLNIS